MPRRCCCASFCTTCLLCRRRKRFDDNLVLVANENSLDSLEVTEKKNRNKVSNFQGTDECCDESCDRCSRDCEDDCSACDDSDVEDKVTEKITSFGVETNGASQKLNQAVEKDSKSTNVPKETDAEVTDNGGNRDMSDGKMTITSNDRVDTPLKNFNRDDFATYLTTKLQRHVDQQFEDTELEAQKLDTRDQYVQSSLIDLNENNVVVGLNGVNKNSFLNKFRATLLVRGKELKDKSNKWKKLLNKESKNERYFRDIVMRGRSELLEGTSVHEKQHTKLDAETSVRLLHAARAAGMSVGAAGGELALHYAAARGCAQCVLLFPGTRTKKNSTPTPLARTCNNS
ncbi:uncharacterized protein LOC125178610 [Hyalella azteca]|uniref:Uncharacterized protein LOC125178610 n=1 Tax=Hyalella azteca TaxID=294128 RepID=A0A979FQL5_HYAAZ|nr:uncharacterized protein LOC125178610 [Hyalella azteca]